jgi:hypothetical protein
MSFIPLLVGLDGVQVGTFRAPRHISDTQLIRRLASRAASFQGVTMVSQSAPSSTPREVATYLKAVRTLLGSASQSRQSWIRELGMLMRTDDPTAADQALAIGNRQRALFVELRAELAATPVPPVCQSAHDAMQSWLDKHVVACDAIVEAGESRDLMRLRVTQGLLAEARVDLSRFNASFAALVQVLQERAARHKRLRRRPGIGWPFRRNWRS